MTPLRRSSENKGQAQAFDTPWAAKYRTETLRTGGPSLGRGGDKSQEMLPTSVCGSREVGVLVLMFARLRSSILRCLS